MTTRGQAKILDFGLAKLQTAGKHLETARPDAPTASIDIDHLTSPGTTVGTVAYMSPEQARGEELDARTDLFSFGAVLYEMATGKRPFSGTTTAVIFEAILNKAPIAPVRLNAELPAELERVINKALEKDRDLRYQHASEMRTDLKRLRRDASSGRSEVANVSPPWNRKLMLGAVAAVIVLVAATTLAFLLFKPLPPPRILATTQITNDSRAKYGYVTDGTRLYYTASSTFLHFENFQVSAKGGESVALPSYTNGLILQDISPDKTELLFSKAGNAYLVGPWSLCVGSVLGGAPRRLGELMITGVKVFGFGAAPSSAAWAPDGQELVYSKGKELHIATRDGAEVRTLCAVNGVPFNPTWSPDGRRIRFDVEDASLSNSIWQVSADGTNLHRLLPDWHGAHCCGSWTPDGKYFVFSSAGNIWAIHEKTRLFRRANREPVQLTTGPMNLCCPVPSPDGKRIFALGRQSRTELARYDSKSGQFLPYLGGLSAEGLDFSRDGKSLTYVQYPDATLWRSNADGTERQQLTFPPLLAFMPRWSPDAKQIAFQGCLRGKPWRIYLMSSDGGTPQQVTSGEGGGDGDGDPAWSADGSLLVFDAGYPWVVKNKPVLHVLDLKAGRISVLPGSEGVWSSCWSPNGNYVAGTSPDSQKLMLYDFRTHEQAELVRGKIGYLSWSRDSEFVYFTMAVNDPAFFRVRIRDRKIERIVSLKEAHRTLGTGGPWSGLAPDGSPLIQRDAGTNEIYAFDWEAP